MEQATPTPPPVAPANPTPPPVAPVPPPPQPPVAPVSTLEDGGAIENTKKIDWVSWCFMAAGVAALVIIGVYYIRKAKESKKLADNQETLEAKIANLESKIVKPANPYSI